MMPYVVAATGHRPDKLGGYGAFYPQKKLQRLARYHIQNHVGGYPTAGISGMALGWDMEWAQALLDLNIPLIAAVPFAGQESKWPQETKDRYNQILAQATTVHVVSSGGYANWKFQARNEWMVDQAARLTALWDGSSGGTANCIAYAEKKHVPYDNLWALFHIMT